MDRLLWRVAGGVASGGKLRLPVPNPPRSKDCAVLVEIRSAMSDMVPFQWVGQMP